MPSEQPPGEPPKSESLPPPAFDVDDIEVAGGTGEKPQERVTGDVVGEAIDASVGQKENESIPAEEPPAPEKQSGAKEKKKKPAKPKAGVKKAKPPTAAPLPPVPSAGAATPPAPPAPAAQPQAPRTPEEAGMIGTGWKEESAAGAVGVPARRESGTGGIAPLGSGAEPLHARAEVTTPSLENPDFRRYMEQINERGAFTGLGRAGTPELLKSAFECRRAVAQGVIEFYGGQQITGDLGLPFGKEEIAPVISAHIEKLSLEQPEKVIALNNLLVGSRELPRQIAALEARKQKLASGEEPREAVAQIEEKKKTLELAQATNKFWAGLKFLKGEGFGRLTWRKNLRSARKKVREKEEYRTWLGGISAASEPFGGFLRRDGKIDKELAQIKAQLEKATDLSNVETELRLAKNRLHTLKMEILGAGAVHEDTAEIVRRGIQSALSKMLNPVEPSVEGYEAAEKTLNDLERVASSTDPSVLRMDYLRRVNPAEVRVAIQKKSEGEAAKALRSLFFSTLENPHAPERRNTLIAALEPWLGREKIGSKKGALAAGIFILEQIKNFHDTEIIGKYAELQNLRALVESGMAQPEDVERLREAEEPLQIKSALLGALSDQVSAVISARERGAPPSPPLEVPPIISKEKPSPPSPEELETRFDTVESIVEFAAVLSELPSVEFRGHTVEPSEVMRYLREIKDSLEMTSLLRRKPEVGYTRLLGEYIPRLASIGSKKQSHLRAAVRRTILEPFFRAVSGDSIIIASSFDKEGAKAAEQTHPFLSDEEQAKFDREKAKGWIYPEFDIAVQQQKILEAAMNIFSKTA